MLVGVQSPEDIDGQTGVLLANELDLPHVSVVNGVEPQNGAVKVSQEFGAGVIHELSVTPPAVIGIQAARQAPRYVPISRVRQAMQEGGLEEVAATSAELGAPGLTVRRLFAPEATSHAEMLDGDADRGRRAHRRNHPRARHRQGLGGGVTMSNDIFVLVEHHQGTLDETALELLGKARTLASEAGGEAVACVLGEGAQELAGGLPADRVLAVEHPSLAQFNPAAYVAVLSALVKEREPRLVLVANTTVGMDVAASAAARSGRPVVAYCNDVSLDGEDVVGMSQVFGGKLVAEVELAGGGFASIIAGSFPAAEGGGQPEVETIAAPAELDSLPIAFLQRIEPEISDVDITAESILVSVGRGIGGADNIELAEELAEALGGVVSASRPVTDAGWMPKTRQVGKSGSKVKPKLYIACGISGAPEHLEGMRDAELIVAINSDENAPIFDVAHYGTTEDLFDVLPELTEALAGVSA